MIPYAILSGALICEDLSEIPIRILDLSPDTFTFRLSFKAADSIRINRIRLSFYDAECASFHTISLSDFSVVMLEQTEDFCLYQADVRDPAFSSCAMKLMREYMLYIHLKQDGDNAALSEVLTGYDAAGEDLFSDSAANWMQKKMAGIKEEYQKQQGQSSSAHNFLCESKPIHLGIELSSPHLENSFLKETFSDFSAGYWKSLGLEWHPLSQKPIELVYIGNPVCFSLFPDEERLLSLTEHAFSIGVKPVLVLPPVSGRHLGLLNRILDSLCEWYDTYKQHLSLSPIELIVNDFGTLQFLQRIPYKNCFLPVMGTLLNKTKKDPRISYKKGYPEKADLFMENSSNAGFYRALLLEQYRVSRFSYESCGHSVKIPEGRHTLQLPFYQISTSVNCTLYAACHSGTRAAQKPVTHCSKECRTHAFLYPDMLSMIGIGNTLWGLDEKILADASYLKQICEEHIDRIVLSFPIMPFPEADCFKEGGIFDEDHCRTGLH